MRRRRSTDLHACGARSRVRPSSLAAARRADVGSTGFVGPLVVAARSPRRGRVPTPARRSRIAITSTARRSPCAPRPRPDARAGDETVHRVVRRLRRRGPDADSLVARVDLPRNVSSRRRRVPDRGLRADPRTCTSWSAASGRSPPGASQGARLRGASVERARHRVADGERDRCLDRHDQDHGDHDVRRAVTECFDGGGDVTQVGAPLLSCDAKPRRAAERARQGYRRQQLPGDGRARRAHRRPRPRASVPVSSSSLLAVPEGATVEFAGLYWSANAATRTSGAES